MAGWYVKECESIEKISVRKERGDELVVTKQANIQNVYIHVESWTDRHTRRQ